jgi:hypothetical protein
MIFRKAGTRGVPVKVAEGGPVWDTGGATGKVAVVARAV